MFTILLKIITIKLSLWWRNFMLKKLYKFLLGILCSLALVALCAGIQPPKNLNLTSAVNTNGSYNISNGTSGQITVVGDDDTTSNYELTTTATTFAEVFEAIESDSNNTSGVVNINFDNFVLENENSIVLTSQNYTISGSISSQKNAPVFVFQNPSGIEVSFDNLTITNNSYSNLIEVQEASNSAVISVSNTTFSSTATGGYAIFNNGENLTVIFDGTISNTCTFLVNASGEISMSFGEDYSSSTEQISVPYSASNNAIISNISIEDYYTLSFVPLGNYYSINVSHNDVIVRVTSIIDINFDTNGGEFVSDYTAPSSANYGTTTPIAFPTQNNMTNEHFNFIGWFGKITLTEDEMTEFGVSQSIWYFDQNMLAEFAETNYDTSEFSNIFVSSLENVNGEMSFSSYRFDSSETNVAEFLHLKLFAELEKTPTYIALWEDVEYSVYFDSNGGSSVDPITANFGETITAPTAPEKEGYTFDGWYLDNNTFLNEFEFNTMPDTNPTLYAKWNANECSVTFVLSNGENNIVFEGNYGDEITYPAEPERVGYTFDGWFVDDGTFEIPFTSTTLENGTFTAYAKWNVQNFSIYFNSNGGSNVQPIQAEFGSPITAPTPPTRLGYSFVGWYADSALQTEFVFSTMPAQSCTVYARWQANRYNLSFVTNTNSSIQSQIRYYDDDLDLPTDLTKANSIFVGWFLDSNLTIPCEYETMPAQNLTVYAKWQDKQLVSVDTSVQTYNINDIGNFFKNFSALEGFRVQYLVNGEWTTNVPTDAGTYDVRITRSEDATYQSFETMISGGFVITPEVINMTWLIAILFVFAFFEFVVAIIIRRLKKIKASKTYSIALPLLLANTVIETSQIVLLAISGTLALFGFILIIYELVSIHRTVPNFDFDASKYDNRKNLKTVVQEDGEEIVVDERNKQTEDNDYVFSAEDIENMLSDKDYFNKESNRKIINNKVNGTISKSSQTTENQENNNDNKAENDELDTTKQ